MDTNCIEMDLSTRSREVATSEAGCKVRVAKSVFSIRSLVDLADTTDKVAMEELGDCGELVQEGKYIHTT